VDGALGAGQPVVLAERSSMEDEWLWGWDATPGIVSVWAEPEGRAWVWRRLPETRRLVCESELFRPWLLLASLDDLKHLGPGLQPHDGADHPGGVRYRELAGQGALRFRVEAADGQALAQAVLHGATRRLGRRVRSLRELGAAAVLQLPPEEQYLVATGRTYFRGMGFDELRRLQFDLETTGLDPRSDRIFLIAVGLPDGSTETLEATGPEPAAEADLISRFVARVKVIDPDVIENHHLHGFDLPFLVERARALRVDLSLGRAPGLRERPAARGARLGGVRERTRTRFTLPGRELIDSLDAVRRHDFSARDLPGHGLKVVARHFGLASATREYVPGSAVYDVFCVDPARVRRYAADDVREAAAVGRLLGGAAFALAQMAPRRYERLADAGPAMGVIEPLLVRAYLRAGAALPAHGESDGTPHAGAALHLFASGVARRIVKADVASLYPSLMRQYRIGPARDRLGVLLSLIERLVERRLGAKRAARSCEPGSSARYTHEALSSAMKIIVNSAYGYMGAVGLTRFADVHAANEVTRRGRELLDFMCREFASRGVTLLEADTDGVYFAVPESFTEADERRVLDEVARLLPPHVQLEFEGRYASMLSHQPKNYALLPYAGAVILRGVAFRSSRHEPFGEAFLRVALERLLGADVRGVRAAYVDSVMALRRRALATRDVTTGVRLTKAPAEYAATRARRRELSYEAMLAAGRAHWNVGERIRVYRAVGGRPVLFQGAEDEGVPATQAASRVDPRDYDVEFYVRLLSLTFAARLVRAFTPEDYRVVFADPEQPSLFQTELAQIKLQLASHGVDISGRTDLPGKHIPQPT
jgi:DNA polymerase, archaea type